MYLNLSFIYCFIYLLCFYLIFLPERPKAGSLVHRCITCALQALDVTPEDALASTTTAKSHRHPIWQWGKVIRIRITGRQEKTSLLPLYKEKGSLGYLRVHANVWRPTSLTLKTEKVVWPFLKKRRETFPHADFLDFSSKTSTWSMARDHGSCSPKQLDT